MNKTILLTWAAPLLIASPMTSELRTEGEQTAVGPHESIETLIGADVEIPGSAGKDEEAAAGEVKDLLVAADGAVEWAAIELDGRATLVPASKLTWNAQKERFHLDVPRAQLQTKPELDLDAARKNGLSEVIAKVESSWEVPGKAREASAKSQERHFRDTEFVMADASMLCGSRIDELEMYGRKEEFGGIARTFVDPTAMRVDLVVVSRGGIAGIGDTAYLVPFEALALCRKPLSEGQKAADAELLVCVDRSIEALESAPEYEQPDDGGLVSVANKAAAESFFGL